MSKGKANNPLTDKRRLHLGGRPKSDKRRRTFWITDAEYTWLETLLRISREQQKEKSE